MEKRLYHILPVPKGRWAVIKGGDLRLSKIFEAKADAVNFGRTLTNKRNAELVIHRKDGTIQNANSYVNEDISTKV